jgi:hypothetical protein
MHMHSNTRAWNLPLQEEQQQERQQQQQQGVKGGSTEAGAAAHVSMAAPARKLMPSMVKPNATVSSDL